MKKERYKYLAKAQKRAAKLSERTNRALNLSYLVVRNGKLMKILPDGTKEVLGDAKFGTVRIKTKKFILKDD